MFYINQQVMATSLGQVMATSSGQGIPISQVQVNMSASPLTALIVLVIALFIIV